MKATTIQVERAATLAATYFKHFSPELWKKGRFGRYEEPFIGYGDASFDLRVYVARMDRPWVEFTLVDGQGDELGTMELGFARGARFWGWDTAVLEAMSKGLARVDNLRMYVPAEAERDAGGWMDDTEEETR